MIKDIIKSEPLLPIIDYFKLNFGRKKVIKIVFLILIAISSAFICFYYNSNNILKINDYINEYLGIGIEIIALLLSFSIAYLTILITSESNSIKKIQLLYISKENEKNKITAYQYLLSQLTYTIYNEIALLLIYLLFKLIIPILSYKVIIIIFSISFSLLINVIFIIFVSVKNIYLTFFDTNNNIIVK